MPSHGAGSTNSGLRRVRGRTPSSESTPRPTASTGEKAPPPCATAGEAARSLREDQNSSTACSATAAARAAPPACWGHLAPEPAPPCASLAEHAPQRPTRQHEHRLACWWRNHAKLSEHVDEWSRHAFSRRLGHIIPGTEGPDIAQLRLRAIAWKEAVVVSSGAFSSIYYRSSHQRKGVLAPSDCRRRRGTASPKLAAMRSTTASLALLAFCLLQSTVAGMLRAKCDPPCPLSVGMPRCSRLSSPAWLQALSRLESTW
jgi:hypothetical protein